MKRLIAVLSAALAAMAVTVGLAACGGSAEAETVTQEVTQIQDDSQDQQDEEQDERDDEQDQRESGGKGRYVATLLPELDGDHQRREERGADGARAHHLQYDPAQGRHAVSRFDFHAASRRLPVTPNQKDQPP